MQQSHLTGCLFLPRGGCNPGHQTPVRAPCLRARLVFFGWGLQQIPTCNVRFFVVWCWLLGGAPAKGRFLYTPNCTNEGCGFQVQNGNLPSSRVPQKSGSSILGLAAVDKEDGPRELASNPRPSVSPEKDSPQQIEHLCQSGCWRMVLCCLKKRPV